MDVKTIADNFDVLLDAPGALASLKHLILELAARGALVAQDVNDIPTAAQGSSPIKWTESTEPKTRVAPKLSYDAIPHSLPKTWKWIPITEAFYVVPVSKIKIKSSEIQAEGRFPVVDQGKEFISGKADNEERVLRLENPVIVFGDHTCEIKYVDFDFIPGADGTKVLSPLKVHAKYFYWMLKRIRFENKGYSRHFKFLAQNWFPLAPLQEQPRIVSKVEQLMQLCDELEQKQAKALKARSRFNAASLDKLVTARDADEFDECWGKVRENFNLHLQSPESIPPFKEALFTLAVQGRLVPQNSADESAHDVESKLEAFRESEKQPKSGTVAKSDLPISEHELPFPIPSNWTWVRLGTLAELITKGSSPRWQGVRYVDPSKEDGLLFITSTNVLSFELDLADPSYVEPRFNEIEPRSILRRGDFLMNLVGASIGRTAIYDRDYVANINQAVCLIRPLSCSGIFDPRYLLTFFNSPACIRYMFDKQVDMARANLSMTNVARFLVPLPPLPEQVRIVDKIKQISSALTTMSHQFTNKLSYETRLAKAMCRSALAPNDRLIRPTESDQSTRTSTHEAYTCS